MSKAVAIVLKRRRFTLALLVCFGWILSAHADDETDLWRIWSRSLENPERHEAHATAYQQFAQANAGSPLAPTARTLAAWHLLQLQRHAEAREILAAQLQSPRDLAGRGAHQLALAWLSRLDREKVAAALDVYRVREVRYPETLAVLATDPGLSDMQRPPPADRWGQPWTYRLERMRVLSGVTGQRYRLESRTLGETSALSDALAIPLASRIPHQPVRVFADANRIPAVQLKENAQAQPVVLTLGAKTGSIRLDYASPRLVILHDNLHFKLTRPATP